MDQFNLLNNEQILELCLIAVAHNVELLKDYPGEFLTYYVIKNSTKELSDDEIADQISDLICSHVMESLTRKGYLEPVVDEDGNISLDLA